MKHVVLVGGLLLVVTTALTAERRAFDLRQQALQSGSGPYLGQKPPAGEPVLFAPGIVSNGSNASTVTISPDGREMCWDVDKIWCTKSGTTGWTTPEKVAFCKNDSHLYRVPFITPDGKRMYFISTRPGTVSQDKENIWYVDRAASGWSEPTPVSTLVNDMKLHWSISVSRAGTLWFGSNFDIYCSRSVDGVHQKPVDPGPNINTPAVETCPYIAPDESYVIFNRLDQANPTGSGILISFRDKSGSWLPAVMLHGGSRERGGMAPTISPDGQYLFYANGGIYWMPVARLIAELRPK